MYATVHRTSCPDSQDPDGRANFVTSNHRPGPPGAVPEIGTPRTLDGGRRKDRSEIRTLLCLFLWAKVSRPHTSHGFAPRR